MPDPGSQLHQARSARSPLAWATLFIVMAIGLGADLGSKSWSFATVIDKPVVLDRTRMITDPSYDPVPLWHQGRIVIPHVLQFRLIINRGAVFGVGANQRAFFVSFTAFALIGAVVVFGTMTTRGSTLAHIGAGFILAGGAGNLFDRICFGAVRDFLHMFPGLKLPMGWTWPGGNPDMFPWVFNIADLLLLLGMLLLTPRLQRTRRRREVEAVAAAG